MKAMTLLSIAGLLGVGLPQAFAQSEGEQAVVYAAPAVVYEAPVVYESPVVYQGPVIYAAPVYYATPIAYEQQPVYSPIAPGSDLGGYFSSYRVSPNVLIVGDSANDGGYYSPYYYSPTVIYFGGRQAASQGYNFGYGW